MKKILFLFFISFLLVGCNSIPEEELNNESNQEFADNSNSTINVPEITSTQNDFEKTVDSNLEPEIIQVNLTIENDNGIVTNYNFSHIELYPTFESMLASDKGEFRYLKLEEIKDFSIYSNMYTFEDLNTNEKIDVVFYKNIFNFIIGENYMIHVFTDIEYDYYFVSDVQHGIF
ncbi:MAG: hypothetical protein UMR38_01400 [Candidatus Izemoplasma sp.]|nr:hypothetical protein [Candidatus Izemoplasma sp.]